MAAKRTVYWVSPDDGGWRVKKQGADRASSIHRTKDEAVKRAVDLAKNQKPAQVRIQRKNDTIGDERTYDGDPYPPEG